MPGIVGNLVSEIHEVVSPTRVRPTSYRSDFHVSRVDQRNATTVFGQCSELAIVLESIPSNTDVAPADHPYTEKTISADCVCRQRNIRNECFGPRTDSNGILAVLDTKAVFRIAL